MSSTMSSIAPAALPIKVFTTLEGFFPDLQQSAEEGLRWNRLIESFIDRFGRPPTHVARAPGRVNLIGEHIDYCLFGVLPTAIERDILVACAPSTDPESSAINVHNLDDRYAPEAIQAVRLAGSSSWTLPIDKTKLKWESYVKAAYHGILERFFSLTDSSPRGGDFLFSGSVPTGAGVSSSAAMVVSSTLAFLSVNDKLNEISQGELVELCMENEKRVGVNSGGMDQGASVFSTPSSALYISFFPKLSATPVPLPRTNPPTVFVIANSLVTANKLETSKIHYNLRVVETLVAARVLARGLGLEIPPGERVRLREVLDRWTRSMDKDYSDEDEEGAIAALKTGLHNILPQVEKILGTEVGQRGHTLGEMVEASGLSDQEFTETYGSAIEAVEATNFHLYKRAKHVFSEALRVLQFREVSINAAKDTVLPPATTRQALARQLPQPIPNEATNRAAQLELGALMDASHESCDRLFDCSAPELNELTRIAKESGALGSRLTGAGWGGCTVSLVPEASVKDFIEKLSKAYPRYNGLSPQQLQEAVFATKPGSGAGVYKITTTNGQVV